MCLSVNIGAGIKNLLQKNMYTLSHIKATFNTRVVESLHKIHLPNSTLKEFHHQVSYYGEYTKLRICLWHTKKTNSCRILLIPRLSPVVSPSSSHTTYFPSSFSLKEREEENIQKRDWPCLGPSFRNS